MNTIVWLAAYLSTGEKENKSRRRPGLRNGSKYVTESTTFGMIHWENTSVMLTIAYKNVTDLEQLGGAKESKKHIMFNRDCK